MSDRKNIIKKAERIMCSTVDRDMIDSFCEDVIALLKEQEPVKPDSFMDGRVQRFVCKKCGKHLLYAEWGRDNYCSKCGQAVKWNG